MKVFLWIAACSTSLTDPNRMASASAAVLNDENVKKMSVE
jgi:hypothetical protein